MKYFSLFSGIGGFELGIQQAYESNFFIRDGQTKTTQPNTVQQSVESASESTLSQRDSTSNISGRNTGEVSCIGYSEIDKYACEIYERHFNHRNYGDISKINAKELPDFDLLVGGFPCQSFSIAGQRGGFDDTRGTLFFEIARIAAEKRPSYLLLENVKGLLSHDKGRTFGTILTALDEIGYDAQWEVLNSKNFGVPQNRERVFIVGHSRGTPRPQVFPIERTDETYIEEYPTICGSSQRHAAVMNGQVPCLSQAMGAGGVQIPMKFEDICIRRLTPRECEALQGFPDNWTEGIIDSQRYKTLGNAVTVNVVQAVMERLI